MEYIQCQHCDRKYSVSDKLRAGAGKKIRCKHCGQVFQITIHDDDMPPEEKTRPSKKKINVQLLISMMLGFSLICASVGAYLFFYKPELLIAPEQRAALAIIPQRLVHPMNIKPPNQTHITASEATKPLTPVSSKKMQASTAQKKQDAAQKQPVSQVRPAVKKAISIFGGSDHPSQVCKDVAADYWLRTRVLATTRLETGAYMKLLRMNMQQAEEIRKLCRDKLLVGRITAAATAERKPAWISVEIKSRMLTEHP